MCPEEKPRLLVVDDEPNIRTIIHRILSLNGYQVELASDAGTARKKLAAESFDLLITDHQMPGETGLQLIIGANRSHPDMIKILLTGVGNRDLYREAINQGDIFSVVEKPFSGDELRETVQRALEHRFQRLGEILEIQRIRDQYAALFTRTTDLIQCVDPRGGIIYVNPAWHTTLGHPSGVVSSLTIDDIVMPDYRDLFRAIPKRIAGGETVAPFECVFSAANGSAVYLEGSAVGQFQDNELVAVTYFLRDCTDRKRAEEQLQERLRQEIMIARIANLLAATEDPAVAYPAILQIMGIAAKADSVLLYSRDTGDGQFIQYEQWTQSLLSTHDLTGAITPSSAPSLFRSVNAGNVVAFPLSGDFPTADTTHLAGIGIKALLALPIAIGERTVGALLFAHCREPRQWEESEIALLRAGTDILANAWHRQIEIEARKQKEHEAEQSRLLVIRADRLAALGTMAAGIIHEITQPLNAITVSTQTILYGIQRGWELDSQQVTSSLNLIVEQVNRMSTIIKNMRSFARDGQLSRKNYENLNEQVERVLSMLGEQLRYHDIELTTSLGDIPPVRINPQQLLQVLLNLVTNARQALEEIPTGDKRIHIGTRFLPELEKVEISVADTGPGVPEALREQIFNPFFTTKEVGTGTGLGLSISAGFVEEHRGTIHYEPNDPTGAVFVIRLPYEPPNEEGQTP